MDPAAKFNANAPPANPYRNFKFQVWWQDRLVAGFSKLDALKNSVEPVKWRSGPGAGRPGANGHRAPGQVDWEPIRLERGVTHDEAFERWASKLWYYARSPGHGRNVSLGDFRADLTIDLMNEAGQRVRSWVVSKCWPIEFSVLPDLDASSRTVAIDRLRLAYEGLQAQSQASSELRR